MFSAKFDNNNVYITNYGGFDLPHTLDCGQAFRWEETENGIWHGVAFNKYLQLQKLADGTVVLYNTSKEDFEGIWRHYFDLDRDYDEIITAISEDETLKKASEYAHGIRVLNQEPWETLCSFIISQNNNIKRIKGIISRLCENFGENKGGFYTFPTAAYNRSLSVGNIFCHIDIRTLTVYFIIRIGICYARKADCEWGTRSPVLRRKKKYFFHMLKILTFMLKNLI